MRNFSRPFSLNIFSYLIKREDFIQVPASNNAQEIGYQVAGTFSILEKEVKEN